MPEPDATEVVKVEMDRIRGRICGFLESLQMPEKAERGAIATAKALSYDAQKAITEAIERERELR